MKKNHDKKIVIGLDQITFPITIPSQEMSPVIVESTPIAVESTPVSVVSIPNNDTNPIILADIVEEHVFENAVGTTIDM